LTIATHALNEYHMQYIVAEGRPTAVLSYYDNNIRPFICSVIDVRRKIAKITTGFSLWTRTKWNVCGMWWLGPYKKLF